MNEREISDCELIVSRGDSSEMFQFIEHPLNKIGKVLLC